VISNWADTERAFPEVLANLSEWTIRGAKRLASGKLVASTLNLPNRGFLFQCKQGCFAFLSVVGLATTLHVIHFVVVVHFAATFTEGSFQWYIQVVEPICANTALEALPIRLVPSK
jgi:hypothetical protein